MIIAGRIIDKKTKKPIPYIKVDLDDLSTPEVEYIISSVGWDGKFAFPNLPDGAYLLKVRSQMHEPYSEKIYSERQFMKIELRKITF